MSFTPASDYTPSGSTAVAPSANPGSVPGFTDQAGSVWGLTASNTITPSGAPASASGNNYGVNDLLLNNSAAAANTQQRLRFNYTNNSGWVLYSCVRVTGSGSTLNGYAAAFVEGSGVLRFFKIVNGNATTLGADVNFSAVSGTDYYLTASIVGTTLSGSVVRVSDGVVMASGSRSDTSVTGSGQTGIYNYLPTAGSFQAIEEVTQYTYVAPVNLPVSTNGVPSSNIVFSPGNWDLLKASSSDYGVTVDSLQTTNCGAYFRFAVTGTTSVGLLLDLSPLTVSGNTVLLAYSIDNGPLQSLQLTSAGSSAASGAAQTLAQNLSSSATHNVEVFIKSINTGLDNQSGRYSRTAGTSMTNVMRLAGIQVDTGGALAPFSIYPVAALNVIFEGDSIGEGAFAETVGGSAPVDNALLAYGPAIASALGAECGQHCFSGTGIDWAPNYSGAAPLKTNFNSFSSGRPRAPANIFAAFIVLGTNDALNSVSDATVVSDLGTILPAMRTMYGASTWLFVVSPPGGFKVSALNTAVSNYQSANPSDVYIARIDVSDTLPTTGLTNSGASEQAQVEGLHPQARTQAKFAAAVAKKAQALISNTYPAASAVQPTDLVLLSRGGQTLQIAASAVKSYVAAGGS